MSPPYPAPFEEFEPTLWHTKKRLFKNIAAPYVVGRAHGVEGRIIYHNLTDEVNEDIPFLDKILLEYQIGDRGYVIFSVRDIFEAPYSFSHAGFGNITGELGERISRRIVKFFLKHLSDSGKTGGIFDKRFNPQKKNGYLVANTDTYVLKIDEYPNLVILEKDKIPPWQYTCIKELDGLFDYRYGNERHILVLETKLDKLQINCAKLKDNLFSPLEKLLPDAHFHYILFSSEHALYKHIQKYPILREKPLEIYTALKEQGISTIFFTFNESRDAFDRMAHHLVTQYSRIGYQTVEFSGRIVMDHHKIAIYNNGENPFLYLEKDKKLGYWRETPFK
ncbi:hypothetical protein [Chitinivibrio alkaliphilus]|uniref:Uncharacterized protein n=1 Tax=Chitinivibrio alkaliphilus ACht1 TaxID=1313304 RepID=U7D8B6_9BACT|nr:hypothetical protein [Chitinivibrio alkaliphilus]ERP31811.1 hypothetical protein CALK_1257 [Chitinivibrio alkaliphilus ACht1]